MSYGGPNRRYEFQDAMVRLKAAAETRREMDSYFGPPPDEKRAADAKLDEAIARLRTFPPFAVLTELNDAEDAFRDSMGAFRIMDTMMRSHPEALERAHKKIRRRLEMDTAILTALQRVLNCRGSHHILY